MKMRMMQTLILAAALSLTGLSAPQARADGGLVVLAAVGAVGYAVGQRAQTGGPGLMDQLLNPAPAPRQGTVYHGPQVRYMPPPATVYPGPVSHDELVFYPPPATVYSMAQSQSRDDYRMQLWQAQQMRHPGSTDPLPSLDSAMDRPAMLEKHLRWEQRFAAPSFRNSNVRIY